MLDKLKPLSTQIGIMSVIFINKMENKKCESDIVQRLGYVVFIHRIGVRLPVSENFFLIEISFKIQITFIFIL